MASDGSTFSATRKSTARQLEGRGGGRARALLGARPLPSRGRRRCRRSWGRPCERAPGLEGALDRRRGSARRRARGAECASGAGVSAGAQARASGAGARRRRLGRRTRRGGRAPAWSCDGAWAARARPPAPRRARRRPLRRAPAAARRRWPRRAARSSMCGSLREALDLLALALERARLPPRLARAPCVARRRPRGDARVAMRATRRASAMNENAARPMRMSPRHANPTRNDPAVEKSDRASSPKSSPTSPPAACAAERRPSRASRPARAPRRRRP